VEFIDRKEELEKLEKGVLAGENFVIIAPRRYGKTTLIRKMLDDLRDRGVLTLYEVY
jgi:AAA+ ATPase superfamily predicted ATPase